MLVNVCIEEIVPCTNPWSIEEKKLVPCLVDEAFVSAGAIILFIGIRRWRLMLGPSTFRFITGIVVVVVIGDICKLATEAFDFSLSSVFVNFVLPGNLPVPTRSHSNVS